LADLAREDVPDAVLKAYGGGRFSFGRDYLIPKPFDARVLTWESRAVARAAVETGVARVPISDWDEYTYRLERRILGKSHQLMRNLIQQSRRSTRRRIVMPDPLEEKVLRAAQTIVDEQIAEPILVGNPAAIRARAAELEIELDGVTIIDRSDSARLNSYVTLLAARRADRGMTVERARVLLEDPAYYGVMMVNAGDADGFVTGINRSYPDTIRPALEVMTLKPGVSRVAGMYCIAVKNRVLFFADATVNIDPTAEELADIAISTAHVVKEHFDMDPRVAMISFSNFGSVKHPFAEKMARAAEIARGRKPELVIDGEMAPDTALVPEIADMYFPDSLIAGDANVLIFPDVQSGNIALKLVQHLAGGDVIGPILMGLAKPVNVLNYSTNVAEIVNITAITAVMADAG
jgi:malate dehydrogenase (oxaloacetate-decarboxylating)(NADP+)